MSHISPDFRYQKGDLQNVLGLRTRNPIHKKIEITSLVCLQYMLCPF